MATPSGIPTREEVRRRKAKKNKQGYASMHAALTTHHRASDNVIRRLIIEFARNHLFPSWWPVFLIPIIVRYKIEQDSAGHYYGDVIWYTRKTQVQLTVSQRGERKLFVYYRSSATHHLAHALGRAIRLQLRL